MRGVYSLLINHALKLKMLFFDVQGFFYNKTKYLFFISEWFVSLCLCSFLFLRSHLQIYKSQMAHCDRKTSSSPFHKNTISKEVLKSNMYWVFFFILIKFNQLQARYFKCPFDLIILFTQIPIVSVSLIIFAELYVTDC